MPAQAHELSITRYIAAPPEKVFRTYFDRQEEWFAPRPWTSSIIVSEPRAGGRSVMTMTSPEGEETPPMEGVFLEVVENARIVFTDAFTAGWVPQGPFMVAIVTLAPEGEGTRYTATARHWSAKARARHEEMGFSTGWAICADQLAALCA
ncbi:SRPBCC family protein [Sphingobium aquiterrae]|uniref:SRPBCC family protein n=1 Tax=Sphingobium aquiterrae TaxID=2038656 RepID=UPI003AFB2826